MFLGAALKLCPDLKTIPYDFEGYQEVAKKLYDTVAQYTHDIQVKFKR
jgi:DNA repair protein REV1